MGLLERFFHLRPEKRPAVMTRSERAVSAGTSVPPLSRVQHIRDGLAQDISLITPDMPYEEAQRRFDALRQYDLEMPHVKVSK
ncbi:hypothetical protein HYW44_04345 [Candidatus Daviesbacteria bacterium]|nr:hypothetical protein [Candidatus Daviesbacteria bacterium]